MAVEKVSDFVKSELKNVDASHDFYHITRVLVIHLILALLYIFSKLFSFDVKINLFSSCNDYRFVIWRLK